MLANYFYPSDFYALIDQKGAFSKNLQVFLTLDPRKLTAHFYIHSQMDVCKAFLFLLGIKMTAARDKYT
jgi:hypothetical protein